MEKGVRPPLSGRPASASAGGPGVGGGICAGPLGFRPTSSRCVGWSAGCPPEHQGPRGWQGGQGLWGAASRQRDVLPPPSLKAGFVSSAGWPPSPKSQCEAGGGAVGGLWLPGGPGNWAPSVGVPRSASGLTRGPHSEAPLQVDGRFQPPPPARPVQFFCKRWSSPVGGTAGGGGGCCCCLPASLLVRVFWGPLWAAAGGEGQAVCAEGSVPGWRQRGFMASELCTPLHMRTRGCLPACPPGVDQLPTSCYPFFSEHPWQARHLCQSGPAPAPGSLGRPSSHPRAGKQDFSQGDVDPAAAAVLSF
ncbi:uncharacterized protein LOC143824711 [Paroedura picta]|uniref:uncharacterized protein LOC143824711 n=1 Tax=Paroedura picta TaxID=143630 RepID=UPI004056BED1